MTAATNSEVLAFIEAHRLFGLGLGFVDMHILAAAHLDKCRVWSRDKVMRAGAEKLRIAF
ncbi:MAG: hypothetical protein ABIW76_03530 [Fibrobacteria bacterium]